MFFFVGEFGFNTEKKNNGNKGGQNFFVGPVTVPRKCDSMSNTRLNGLAFMNAMEEPVMMRIIFAAETISGFNNIVVDIFSELFKGVAGEDMQENYRKINGILVSKLTNIYIKKYPVLHQKFCK